MPFRKPGLNLEIAKKETVMMLWHQKLIPYLDDRMLLGLHREICALREDAWCRKYATVDYVFKYEYSRLYEYHLLVMGEMMRRGFDPGLDWYDRLYRGKNCPRLTFYEAGSYIYMPFADNMFIYPEHDDRYLLECLDNLAAKGAELVNGGSIAEMRVRLAVEKGI